MRFTLKSYVALTSVAQLVGHHPAKQKVTGSNPSQAGHMPWLWARSPVGAHMRGN